MTENNQVENQVENQVDLNLKNFITNNSENIVCNIFKEQFDMINQLPETERLKVLYLAVFNAFYKEEESNKKNQVENQVDYTYISISNSIYNSLSNYSRVLLKLLDKTLICKNYKNWGGKRKNSGRKKEVTPIKDKKTDPFVNNSVIECFMKENLKQFGCRLYLDAQQRQRIMELNAEIDGFIDTIPEVFAKLKKIDFDLPNFNPNGVWLLRESNYTNVLNGLYDGKQKTDIWEELRQKERLRNGTA